MIVCSLVPFGSSLKILRQTRLRESNRSGVGRRASCLEGNSTFYLVLKRSSGEGTLKRQRPTWQHLEIFECCGQSDKMTLGNGDIARVEERGARLGEPKLRRSSELGVGGGKTLFGGRSL